MILENPDLEKGYLKDDKIVIRYVSASAEVPKQSHYEVVKEYPNGGKDMREVVDVPYKPAVEAHEETEDIKVYIPYSEAEFLERKKQALRMWRGKYFEVIDRAAWYDSLSPTEKMEVQNFRKSLLDITATNEYPVVPVCVAKQVKD